MEKGGGGAFLYSQPQILRSPILSLIHGHVRHPQIVQFHPV